MKVQLHAVGTRMPRWVEDGFHEYQRRLQADITLHLREIAPAKRTAGSNTAVAMDDEGKKLLAACKPADHVVALDVTGRTFNTPALAQHLSQLSLAHREIIIWIGGPDGIAPAALARANERWSLSPLTLPHPLVRVLLAEQIYRAWTLLKGHPYHK